MHSGEALEKEAAALSEGKPVEVLNAQVGAGVGCSHGLAGHRGGWRRAAGGRQAGREPGLLLPRARPQSPDRSSAPPSPPWSPCSPCRSWLPSWPPRRWPMAMATVRAASLWWLTTVSTELIEKSLKMLACTLLPRGAHSSPLPGARRMHRCRAHGCRSAAPPRCVQASKRPADPATWTTVAPAGPLAASM